MLADSYTFSPGHPFFAAAVELFAACAFPAIANRADQPWMWIRDGHWRLELHDLDTFAACVRTYTQPSSITVRPTFWTDSEGVKPQGSEGEASPIVAGSLVLTSAVIALGYAYESNRDLLVSRFGARVPGNWPPDFQLARHIRNGCFHGNKFDIRNNRDGSSPIDTGNPPAWETLALTSAGAFNGKTVVGAFLPFAFVFPFLHDIGNRLVGMGWAAPP